MSYLPSNGQKANVCADPGNWYYYLDSPATVSSNPYILNDVIHFDVASIGSSKFAYLRYQLEEAGSYTATVEVSVETPSSNLIDISGGNVSTADSHEMSKESETYMKDLDNVTEGRVAVRLYNPFEVPSVISGKEKVPVKHKPNQ